MQSIELEVRKRDVATNPSKIRRDGDIPGIFYGAGHFGGTDADYDAVKHEGLRGPGQAAGNSYEVIDGTAVTSFGFLRDYDYMTDRRAIFPGCVINGMTVRSQ